MWFSKALWTILTTSFLICTSSAYSSYADFEASNSAQYPSSHKSSTDSRWNELDEESSSYLYGTDSQRELPGGFLDLNSWPEKESDSMSRQLFGDKSAESTDNLRNRGLDTNEDLPKKRESHSLSIVNPLDVLRQRLMLEMARRRMKENQDQIRENEVILKNLGKRAISRNSHENVEDKENDDSRTNQNYLRRIYVSNSKEFDV